MVWLQNSCVVGKKRISTNENIVISMSNELLNVAARVENKGWWDYSGTSGAPTCESGAHD